MLHVDINKINDFYVRETFKQLIEYLAQQATSGNSTKTVTNNIVQSIPLDGSTDITGTIVPDTTDTHNLGSQTQRFNEIHTKDLYIDNNTLYVGGSPAISKDETGAITLSNDANKDVKIEAKGSGKVILDCESDVEITTTGNVTINNANLDVQVNFHHMEITPAEIINNFDFVIGHVPITNSETITYNGMVLCEGIDKDYTRNANTVTLNFAIGGDDLITIKYAY